MRSLQTLKRDLQRVALRALLALFLVPALTLAFTSYVRHQVDKDFLFEVEQDMLKSGESVQAQEEVLAVYRAVPPSAACTTTVPELAKYRAGICPAWGAQWQFHWVHRATQWMLAAGVALAVAIAVLGWWSFRGRAAQYRSLVVAWRLLSISGAAEVVLQSALLVWLSFWVTAHFFHLYSIKLVAIVGICALGAAFLAVVQIFKRPQGNMFVEGELVREADAPALWQRIRALAAQLKTTAPNQVIAGIDANFFVTEAKITLPDNSTVEGRSLFVSLPLLRVLDQREADAVLAHELAHLSGGDTASSALLGPKLTQFDHYLVNMHGGGLTLVAYYLLDVYRMVLELALMRDSRKREFKADRAAARLLGGRPLITALVKVAAYSSYRSRIEDDLFRRDQQHAGQIGIATFVADGLRPFAYSEEFQSVMEEANVPHPFDSHPKLSERMANVKSPLPATLFGPVIANKATVTWAGDILTADAIEARLWADYEGRFAQAHERDLAYRYAPSTEEERAIVLKYFPPQAFALSSGTQLVVSIDGLQLPNSNAALGWDCIHDMEYEDGMGGDVLTLTVQYPRASGTSKEKVKLPGIKPRRDELKQVLGAFRHRHEVSRRG